MKLKLPDGTRIELEFHHLIKFDNGAYTCWGKLRECKPEGMCAADFRFYSANHLLIIDYGVGRGLAAWHLEPE